MARSGRPDLALYIEPMDLGERCATPGCAWPALQNGLCRQCAWDRVRTDSPGGSTAALLIDEISARRHAGHGPQTE
jgi:hypothetical protein